MSDAAETSAPADEHARTSEQENPPKIISLLVPVAFAVAAFVAALLLIRRDELAATPATAYAG